MSVSDNALIARFEEEKEKIGVIGAVRRISDLLLENPPVEKENIEEADEFAKYLREVVFSDPENHKAMVETWGHEPPIISRSCPIDPEATECVDRDPDLLTLSVGEMALLMDNTVDFMSLIRKRKGELTLTYCNQGAVTLRCDEDMRADMDLAIMSFLETFIRKGNFHFLLVVHKRYSADGKKVSGTAAGFVADDLDYYAIPETDLRRALSELGIRLEKGIRLTHYGDNIYITASI